MFSGIDKLLQSNIRSEVHSFLSFTVIKSGKRLLYNYFPFLVEVVSNILLCFFQPTEDTDNIDILPTTGMVCNNF